MINSNSPKDLFFEKQSLFSLKCGLHSLNNLLGQHSFEKDDLNDICYELSDDFINPHKHILGGEFDVNVLIVALQKKGYESQWINSKKFEVDTPIPNSRRLGFLLNRQLKSGVLNKIFKVSNRHWIAIRKVQNNYVILDSKTEEKRVIEEKELSEFIKGELKINSELIEIYKPVSTSNTNGMDESD